ncbi:MAG: hypothetical protein RML10_09770 [Geminocystis sp.]|nr:hypothetical protein [Geminocystis sp.]
MERWIEFRKTYDINLVVEPEEEQYNPRDLELFHVLPEYYNFMDIGAYVGDTLEYLTQVLEKKGKKLKTYIAFEPDRENFSKLVLKTKEEKYANSQFILLPLGCYSESRVFGLVSSNCNFTPNRKNGRYQLR